MQENHNINYQIATWKFRSEENVEAMETTRSF